MYYLLKEGVKNTKINKNAKRFSGRRAMLNELVLVLNKSWTPISITSVRKALLLIYSDSAAVVCPKTYVTFDFDSWIEKEVNGGAFVQGVTQKIPLMEVICLNTFNSIPRRELAFTKKNVLRRDNYTCQYCNHHPRPEDLTIDHIIPKSRGGETLWENCVAACKRCNKIKGNRLLKETKLKLNTTPFRPRWDFRFILSPNKFKDSWKHFIHVRFTYSRNTVEKSSE